MLGNPSFGCDLSPIDFAAYARSCGAQGFHCSKPDEVRAAIHSLVSAPGPAILDAIVDADEKPAMPDELKV